MGNVGLKQAVVTPENVTTVLGVPWTSEYLPQFQELFSKIKGKFLWIAAKADVSIQNHHYIPIQAMRQRADFMNQILRMIDNEGLMLAATASLMKYISAWMDSWINKTDDLGVPKISICLEETTAFSQCYCLDYGMQQRQYWPFFSWEKQSLLNGTLQFWNNLATHLRRLTRNWVVHAR